MTGLQPNDAIINQNYTKDGTLIFCKWTNFAVLNQSGELVSIVSFISDVSEQHEIQTDLRRSRNQFQRLVKDIGDNFVIFSYDSVDTSIFYITEGTVTLFGIESKEFIGKSWKEMIQWIPEDLELANSMLTMIIDQDISTNQQFDLRFIHPNGKLKTIQFSQHTVINEDGQLIAIEGIIEDITERKQVETL